MIQIPERRQIVFNWLFGDDITKTDGWWGGSDEVKQIDELLAALDGVAEAALLEAQECTSIQSHVRNCPICDKAIHNGSRIV